MPKPSQNPLVRCKHFSWRLSRRDDLWYADGRTNPINVGRHSLGTRDKAEAMKLLHQLDQAQALKFGIIKSTDIKRDPGPGVSLVEGRRLYESHLSRPQMMGGVRQSTFRRYGPIFNKFEAFAARRGIGNFNQVDASCLTAYVGWLEQQEYAEKTVLSELVLIRQCVNWLAEAGYVAGHEPIKLKLQRVEGKRAYCYRPAEVQAMIDHCRATSTLGWLGNVIVALACTGMRIGELAGLKWADIDLDNRQITLTDETGHRVPDAERRTLKNGRSRRFPIHSDLLVVLRRLARIDSYVFHGPRGKRLHPDKVRRILIRDVLTPLAERFTSSTAGKGFLDGRLHSFRHYFISACAANHVPERVVMEWVGHADSDMVRHYFHLHDEESKRQMNGVDFLGTVGRTSGEVSVSSHPS